MKNLILDILTGQWGSENIKVVVELSESFSILFFSGTSVSFKGKVKERKEEKGSSTRTNQIL